MTTVVNVRTTSGPYAYIGRANGRLQASKWANPHKITVDTQEDRALSLAKYLANLQRRRDLWLALHELRGQTLACWCHPKLCHGHVLAQLANALTEHGKPCPKCKTPLRASLFATNRPGQFGQFARCTNHRCTHFAFYPPFQITTPHFAGRTLAPPDRPA